MSHIATVRRVSIWPNSAMAVNSYRKQIQRKPTGVSSFTDRAATWIAPRHGARRDMAKPNERKRKTTEFTLNAYSELTTELAFDGEIR